MSDTTWIREGAPVAEYKHGNPDTVTCTTIDRITANQIVLSNGKRYNRAKLRPVGDKSSGYTGWTELRPANDEQARNTAARQAIYHLNHEIGRITRTGKVSNEVDAVALLDQIEAAVRATRQAITGKEA